MTLLELLQLLKKHLTLVIALPVLCAVAMAVVAYGFMANTYTAETTLYVLAQNDGSNSNLQSSMSASQPSPTPWRPTCPRSPWSS